MIIVVVTLVLIQISHCKISLYLLNLDTGKALTSGGSKVQFSDVDFGSPNQLWQFTSDGSLIVSQDDNYLGFDHVTKDLELKQTSDVTWSWVDMKIQATDQSPAQLVCLGPNANQVVSCDKGANITLQVHEVELYNLVKDIRSSIDNATNELKSNLTSVQQKTSAIEKKINETQGHLDQWDKDLPKHIEDFEEHSKVVSDNITLTKGHLEEAMDLVKDDIKTLSVSVENITNHLNSTKVNFTALNTALITYKNNTNTTINQEMERVQGELKTKSANGHIIPDNVYEFSVLFLLALGIVNVMDIGRRLIIYSINQRAPDKYGTE